MICWIICRFLGGNHRGRGSGNRRGIWIFAILQIVKCGEFVIFVNASTHSNDKKWNEWNGRKRREK